MDKTEYLKAKEEIIARLGPAEYDMKLPVNDSARELVKLKNDYNRSVKLSKSEQKEVVRTYKSFPAVPIELTDTDLELFTEEERPVVEDYFLNTNQLASDLSRKYKGFTRQKVVALMRSGPFSVLCDRLYATLMRLEVNNALLKAVRDGNPKILERMAEQTGAMKNQSLDLNINKPLEITPEIAAKLK